MQHEEFEVIDLDEECDPPAFTRARKQAEAKDGGETEEQASEGGAEPEEAIAKEMNDALASEDVRRLEANAAEIVQQVRCRPA